MDKEFKPPKKLLVVVDMQNDFITGSLGSDAAQDIVSNVAEKIQAWDGDIILTLDTHGDDYEETLEGILLPVRHCIDGDFGHDVDINVVIALHQYESKGKRARYVKKYTFGSTALPEIIRNEGYDVIHIVGLCTDICVVSNALILKAHYPNAAISVDASCCAGTNKEAHDAALTTMESCHITVFGK